MSSSSFTGSDLGKEKYLIWTFHYLLMKIRAELVFCTLVTTRISPPNSSLLSIRIEKHGHVNHSSLLVGNS